MLVKNCSMYNNKKAFCLSTVLVIYYLTSLARQTLWAVFVIMAKAKRINFLIFKRCSYCISFIMNSCENSWRVWKLLPPARIFTQHFSFSPNFHSVFINLVLFDKIMEVLYFLLLSIKVINVLVIAKIRQNSFVFFALPSGGLL